MGGWYVPGTKIPIRKTLTWVPDTDAKSWIGHGLAAVAVSIKTGLFGMVVWPVCQRLFMDGASWRGAWSGLLAGAMLGATVALLYYSVREVGDYKKHKAAGDEELRTYVDGYGDLIGPLLWWCALVLGVGFWL